MNNVVQCNDIVSGNASRFLKKNWFTDEPRVTPSAFDLRESKPPESKPPELYVSFFMVEGKSDEDQKSSAIEIISIKRDLNKGGAITILDISECLEKVNDPDDNLISFKDERLPHCGLYYLSSDAGKILTAKTVLCHLAKKRLYKLPPTQASLSLAKKPHQ